MTGTTKTRQTLRLVEALCPNGRALPVYGQDFVFVHRVVWNNGHRLVLIDDRATSVCLDCCKPFTHRSIYQNKLPTCERSSL